MYLKVNKLFFNIFYVRKIYCILIKFPIKFKNIKMNTPIEKINFLDLIAEYTIDNKSNLESCLFSIWNDLSKRSDSVNHGVNKLTFINYFKLDGLLSDRLFSHLDVNKNDYLDSKEFIEGLLNLFSDDFAIISKLIFNFFDFDHDGLITRDDVKILFSYIPLFKEV